MRPENPAPILGAQRNHPGKRSNQEVRTGPVKIITIGGGSSYTPKLMKGFIKRYEELPIREIWLVDIEALEGKTGTVITFA